MASFMRLVGKLQEKSETARAEADQKYRDLVSRCASDAAVTEVAIETALTETGRNLDQLTADVETERERLDNLCVAARREEITEQLSTVHRMIEIETGTFNDALVKLQVNHRETMTELRSRERLYATALARCGEARRHLISGDDRLAAIDTEARELSSRERDLAAAFPLNSRSSQESPTLASQRERIAIRRQDLAEQRHEIEKELIGKN